MKSIITTTNLFIPDIMIYINGRDKVSEIVLNVCKDMVRERRQPVSLNTKLFKELNLSTSQIIAVILEAGRVLMVNFSFTLLLSKMKFLLLKIWAISCGSIWSE